MTIYQIGNLQMKDGVFRKVTSTVREGQTYEITQLNPKIDPNQHKTSDLWIHIEKAFILSKNESGYSQSEINSISAEIEECISELEGVLKAVAKKIRSRLELFFENTADPYKPEITGIVIEGFKDGELFGKIGLDRALPVNDDDLNDISATVPFTETTEAKEIEQEPQIDYV